MAHAGAIKRWDVFWADLNPGIGSEQLGARRPVIVLSNDGINAHFAVVTVLPATQLTGKTRRVYPFEVVLPAGSLTGVHASIVMPQQIRTISKLRLLEKISSLSDHELQLQIENRILEHLGIQFEAEGLVGG